MSETIWKFPLVHQGGNEYGVQEMPIDAKPISAGWQGRDFVVWAIVNPKNRCVPRHFHVASTGHPLPQAMRFGGRLLNRVEVDSPSGLLIFHVFDCGSWSPSNG